MNKSILALAAVAAISGTVITAANACTTAVYNNGDAALTMRTMDWFGHDDATVAGYGKGMKNSYAEGDNAYASKSKFAALKIESFMPGLVAEAMNEAGLEARILYLGTTYTQFAEPTASKKDVDALSVPAWAVDNFESVEEVLTALNSVDIVNTGVCGLPPHNDANHCSDTAPVHYQFADRDGNTAVVEFIAGEMKVYTEDGSAYMSNDPEFSYHLTQDAEKVLPDATIRPADRRMRAKLVVEDLYKRDVTEVNAAKNSMKAAAATAFSGYDQLDNTVDDVFPTLWTIHTDRHNGEWVLDRYDTWAGETYNFEMFDAQKAERQVLGNHPQPQYN